MFMLGKNIQQSGDLLAKISFDQLINIIKGEYKPLIHQIEELRRIQTIDVQAYRKLKTMLPYFTVSIFNPPHRRTENFAYSHYLIIDIDHLSKQNLTPNQVKKQIASNTNVLCAFTSPSNEGLKILFKLQPRINDIALYKNFYKLFAIKFAQQYQFEELIDLKTCDATRATFLSFDPEVFVNYQSLAINYNEFINLDNTLEIEQLQKQIIAYEKNHPTTQTQQTTLSDDILLNIKQKLNPNYKQPQKIPYVPEKLNAIIPSIVTQLEQQGLFIEKIENIQYGKKLKICLQHRWCEINIFYGKKGFSAVRTPKNGSDGELGLIVLQFIQQLLSI